jgi:multidrug resistance efflux pump
MLTSAEAQVSSLREKVRQLEQQLEHQTAEDAQREVMLEQQKKLRLTADVCLTYA